MDWSGTEVVPSEFFELTKEIYKDDKFYSGPSEEDVRFLLSDGHSFFTKNKMWLGVNKSTRLVGMSYPDLTIDGKKTAMFGYFDTLDNLEDSNKLLNEFEIWAKEQGNEQVIGPVNFYTYLQYRIRLNDFERKPFSGEPYNKEYYQGHLENSGYKTHALYHSYSGEKFPKSFYDHMDKKDETRQFQNLVDFDVKALNEKIWMENLEQFYMFIHYTFSQNDFYRPIDKELFFKFYGSSLGKRINTEMSRVVFDKDGHIAAFTLMFAENLLDPVKETLLIKSVGVHPRYQKHNLFNYILKDVLPYFEQNCASGIVCLVKKNSITDKMAMAFHTENRTNYGVFCKGL